MKGMHHTNQFFLIYQITTCFGLDRPQSGDSWGNIQMMIDDVKNWVVIGSLLAWYSPQSCNSRRPFTTGKCFQLVAGWWRRGTWRNCSTDVASDVYIKSTRRLQWSSNQGSRKAERYECCACRRHSDRRSVIPVRAINTKGLIVVIYKRNSTVVLNMLICIYVVE
jgi:hypothetical protein